MTRWYPLDPADDDFLRTARTVTTKVLDVDVPVETLWEALAADDAVVSWGPGATKTRWVGPRPYGVGTVREVTMGGVATVREKFYRWDENERMTFAVAESNRPGIRRFAEDYVVESTPTGSRLTWTVALEVAKASGPTAPIVRAVLSLAVGSMTNGLRKRLERS
ncbi:SRPBCC family protein [Nocardioides sp. NBC_00850]|uniref:SRPBCC family protein n=1 Tax=Nocardioides sp. NBC_00850 TaxID=2976001 RepID=UPI002F9D3479|nr:SRPBCC family protein [Nocardioides sp. NBC_00850]